MRIRSSFAVLAAAAALALTTAHATAQTSSGSISFQARLEGVPNGPVNLTVQFWDAAAGGNPVGAPINVPGQVVGGVVSVPIPIADPTIFDGRTLHAGISINGGQALTPRTMVTSVPYAMTTRGLQVDSAGRVGVGLPAPQNTKFYVPGVSRAISHYFDDGLRYSAQPEVYSVHIEPNTLVVKGYQLSLRTGQGQMMKLDDDPTVPGIWCRRNISTPSITIRGGSDIAEPVSVTLTATVPEVEPGMVMVIDRQSDGRLTPCADAYDTAVAGVISGANALQPGLILKSEGNPLADGEHPLAMTGRVWVWCDAAHGAIHRGDRLTSSTTPGHAMAATDVARADGAVIGKAMTELKEGRGLVLVLVNLQ